MGKEEAKPGPLARRPDNSAFMQQRLPAWSPMLTASTVLPFMYCMAALCMVVGVSLLITVQGTQEMKVRKKNVVLRFVARKRDTCLHELTPRDGFIK